MFRYVLCISDLSKTFFIKECWCWIFLKRHLFKIVMGYRLLSLSNCSCWDLCSSLTATSYPWETSPNTTICQWLPWCPDQRHCLCSLLRLRSALLYLWCSHRSRTRHSSQAWWFMSDIPPYGRLRQEEHCKFEVTLYSKNKLDMW